MKSDRVHSASTNASASSFGWDFQYNAGIILMLKNIKDVANVRVEGEKQDIEVLLNDGNKIYAQAKASVHPDQSSHIKDKLHSAFRTLNAVAEDENVKELLYVTNIPDPFAISKTISWFSGSCSFVPYKDLPMCCQEVVKRLSKNEKMKDYFGVLVFSFVGDAPNRYRIVKEHVCEFLSKLGLSDKGWCERALKRWQLEFQQNSTQTRPEIVVDKESIIWPIIVWTCERDFESEVVDGLDESELELVRSKYKSVIEDKSEKFELVTRVYASYYDFRQAYVTRRDGPTRIASDFVAERWEEFKDEFDPSGLSPAYYKAVIQLVLEKIVRNRLVIDRIRKEVGL